MLLTENVMKSRNAKDAEEDAKDAVEIITPMVRRL
jgi:hypothetical protein